MLLISHYGNAALPMGLKESCSLSLIFYIPMTSACKRARLNHLAVQALTSLICLFEHVLSICFHWSPMTSAHGFVDTIRLQFNLRLIQQMLCNIHLDCIYCSIQLLYNKKNKRSLIKTISVSFSSDRMNKVLTTLMVCSHCTLYTHYWLTNWNSMSNEW